MAKVNPFRDMKIAIYGGIDEDNGEVCYDEDSIMQEITNCLQKRGIIDENTFVTLNGFN